MGLAADNGCTVKVTEQYSFMGDLQLSGLLTGSNLEFGSKASIFDLFPTTWRCSLD